MLFLNSYDLQDHGQYMTFTAPESLTEAHDGSQKPEDLKKFCFYYYFCMWLIISQSCTSESKIKVFGVEHQNKIFRES